MSDELHDILKTAKDVIYWAMGEGNSLGVVRHDGCDDREKRFTCLACGAQWTGPTIMNCGFATHHAGCMADKAGKCSISQPENQMSDDTQEALRQQQALSDAFCTELMRRAQDPKNWVTIRVQIEHAILRSNRKMSEFYIVTGIASDVTRMLLEI